MVGLGLGRCSRLCRWATMWLVVVMADLLLLVYMMNVLVLDLQDSLWLF